MKDSVTKNLQVEHLVAEELGSGYIPHHHLCNAHTSEKFDATFLSVLTSVEKEISLTEKIESSYPQLKAFYRGRKSIECALVAPCKLITPDTSAKSSIWYQSREFDIITESKGRVKLASIYQERRFTKLGKTAASVVKSIDLYNKLLEQTSKENLLVKAYQLYLNCEFILCAF